jgi:hypothetical protein
MEIGAFRSAMARHGRGPRCVASRASQISLCRLRQINTTGKSAKPVQPSAQKYFASAVGQIRGVTPRVSPDERGVAHVTSARWDAVDATLAQDERKAVADGEVVWSWRRDAGVKFVRGEPLAGDGGKKARSPGRARSKP